MHTIKNMELIQVQFFIINSGFYDVTLAVSLFLHYINFYTKYRIFTQKAMSSSTYRVNLFRHSQSHNHLAAKLRKQSLIPAKSILFKRMNTQCNQKSTDNKGRTYLLKKNSKKGSKLITSLSKQNKKLYYLSDFQNRTSFNDLEIDFSHQDASKMKGKIRKNNYMDKIHELDKLIKKKNERKTNHTQLSKQKNKKKDFHVILTNVSEQNLRKQLKNKNKHKDSTVCPLNQYQVLNNKILGAGTFGKVYAAVNHLGQKVAIKKVFIDKSYKCRQIELMQKVQSQFVIRIIDKYTTTEQDDKQYLNIVMPRYDSSFYDFLKPLKYNVSPRLLKCYLYQIFRGIMHLHSRGICHRDLKPQNILIKSNKLAICDLGSAKILKKDESNISYICSRCYRAPELIFGSTRYTLAIDMWSAGCIILQILNKGPFFIAKDSLHHLIQIMKIMGTPSKRQVLSMNPNYDVSNYSLPLIKKTQWNQIFESVDMQLLDLIQKIMVYNPSQRLTAQKALCHQYFDQIRNQSFIKELGKLVETKNFFQFDIHQISMMQKPYYLIPKWYFQQ